MMIDVSFKLIDLFCKVGKVNDRLHRLFIGPWHLIMSKGE